MVKRIIDFIFPIATLPKDQEMCSAVIESYEKFSKKTPSIWFIPLWLFFSLLSITQAFSVYNPATLFCMLIPTLFFVISAGLLIQYRLNPKSTHKNLLGFLFNSYGLISCYAILLYGIFNANSIQINAFISILILSLFVYYIGYWCWLKDFNKRIATAKINKNMVGIGASCGCIGYFIAKYITNNIFIFLSIFLMIFLAFALSAALVNYRQYDNIQRAKNGQPFK